MAIKAILCLLAVSFTQGSVISDSLSGSLSSTTTDWAKEYNFAKLGLQIKLKYEDPANIWKGADMLVVFDVPAMLRPFTMGLTKIELEFTLTAPKIMEGLFEMNMKYTIVRNDAPMKGTVEIFRKMETGNWKYITKVVINGDEAIIVHTDMKNKVFVSCSLQGKTYSLRLYRVRGTSFVVATTVYGSELVLSEFTAVITPDLKARKISIHTTTGRDKTHEAEIAFNPISTEYGVYIKGNVYGPLDCRFILEKTLTTAEVVVSHKKINYVYVHVDGNIKMAGLLPQFFQYTATYDLLGGLYGEGKAKVSFSGLDTEKLLSVSVAPKTGHAYDFEAAAKVEADYSFTISHELKRGELVYYSASHKHTVAFNTPEKFMSLWMDKCHVPTTSPLFAKMQGTYLANLLSEMVRKMAINIDWRAKRIDYKDTVTANGAKHFNIAINTMNSPWAFQFYYPEGPMVRGITFGLRSLFGKDLVKATAKYDAVDRKVVVTTNIDNMIITLMTPTPALATAIITHTELNKEAFKFEIKRQAPKVFKVDMETNLVCIPHLPPDHPLRNKYPCPWRADLKFDVDLNKEFFTLVPAHSLYMQLTKDLKTVMKVDHRMMQLPFKSSIECPLLVTKPIAVDISETKDRLIIQAVDYLPGQVEILIKGPNHIIMYEGMELATVTIDLVDRRVAFGIGLIPTPIFEMTYVADTLLKNTVTFNIVLPIVGKVLGGTAEWAALKPKDLTGLMTLRLKAAVVGTVPVVGDFTFNTELTYTTALPKVTVTAKVVAAFTKGLVAYLPPLDTAVTVILDLKANMVQAVVNGITVMDAVIPIQFQNMVEEIVKTVSDMIPPGTGGGFAPWVVDVETYAFNPWGG